MKKSLQIFIKLLLTIALALVLFSCEPNQTSYEFGVDSKTPEKVANECNDWINANIMTDVEGIAIIAKTDGGMKYKFIPKASLSPAQIKIFETFKNNLK